MLNPDASELARLETTREDRVKEMTATNVRVLQAKERIKKVPVYDDDDAVAKRIKTSIETMESRLGHQLSPTEVAEVVGVSEKVVYSWMSRGKVSKQNLPTLAAVLGVTVEYLLTGAEPDKGSFDRIDQDRFQRMSVGIGGEMSATIIPVPIRELDDLLRDLSPSLPLTPKHLDWLTSTRGTRTMAINVLQADHPYVPTWCFQNCETTFLPTLRQGSFLLMTHRIIPKDNDFCTYLYKRNGRFQIASGYVQWRATQMHHASVAGDLTRTLMTQDLRLMRQPYAPTESDIILTGTSHPNKISRRLLGTLVMVQEWIHWTSLHGQTRLLDRKRRFEEKLQLDWGVTEGIHFSDQADID